MEELPKVQGNIHLVVAQSPGERRALPPPLCPVNGVGHRVGFVRVNGVAVVTELTLYILSRKSGGRSSNKFTV